MANLKLSIDADFKQASKAFQDLANSSETTREKIEEYTSSFNDKTINDFIDRQKLLTASLTGTRGETAAMTAAQRNYQGKIESLIKSGLDPESDAIKRLRTENDSLTGKINAAAEAQKRQEEATKSAGEAMKSAEKAALGMLAAIGASVAAIGIATQKTAEMGDQYAKTARVIGMTAETFQELNYAAKMSGIDNLKGSLEKLNKSVSDVKGGTGSLTSYLKENDQQLLSQLKKVNSNEEAFNLLMGAIKKAPNEFARAGLAQAAFGKSGQDLILLANEGAEGISNLREEARKYGVISNEAAANSEAYLDAQERLKAALSGVATELTAGLMPGLTETITKLADFIAGIDNWEGKLNIAKIGIAGITAALITFTIAANKAKIIEDFQKALTAIKSPAGIASLAIGGLVAGITVLYNLYNKQINQGKDVAARYKEQKTKTDELIASYKNLNPEKKIDKETTEKLIGLYPELSGKMGENSITVGELTTKLEDLDRAQAMNSAKPLIEQMKNLSSQYRVSVLGLEQMKKTLGKDTLSDFEINVSGYAGALKKMESLRDSVNEILGGIGKEINIDTFEIVDTTRTVLENQIKEIEKQSIEEAKKLSQRLSEIELSPGQQFGEYINQVKSYLNQRVDLEKKSGDERIAALEAERNRALAIAARTGEERRAINEAADHAIEEYRKKMADEEEERLKNKTDFITKTLESLKNTEQNIERERQNKFRQFLSGQLDDEEATGEARREILKKHGEILLAQFEENSEEYKSAQAAFNNMLIEGDKKLAEERQAVAVQTAEMILGTINQFAEISRMAEQNRLEERVEALRATAEQELKNEELTSEQKEAINKKLNDDIAKMTDEANNRAYSAAVLGKVIAHAEAGIQTFLAASKALSEYGGGPVGIAMMAATIAAGLANQVKIAMTPIPKISAETGGRFIVPHSVGSDSGLMRVNSDEEVEVTPRGMSGFNKIQNIIVQIEKQTIFDVVNNGIRSGDILIAASNY
jgi:hypothetical protein